MFFAYVPIIGMFLYLHDKKIGFSWEATGILVATFLVPGLFKFIMLEISVAGFWASMSTVLIFLLWHSSSSILGRVRFIYLIFFWLAIEYTFTLLNPPVFNHLPGASFRLWGESIVYVKYTGFQGTTLWLLGTNLLFATCFFTDSGAVTEKFNRFQFLGSSMFGVLPMAISMFAYSGFPEGNLTAFYNRPDAYYQHFDLNPFYFFYREYGEYLGKLSFWTSIIIILSLGVKKIR